MLNVCKERPLDSSVSRESVLGPVWYNICEIFPHLRWFCIVMVASGYGNKSVECYKCGRGGHVSSNCYSNKRKYGEYDKGWSMSGSYEKGVHFGLLLSDAVELLLLLVRCGPQWQWQCSSGSVKHLGCVAVVVLCVAGYA